MMIPSSAALQTEKEVFLSEYFARDDPRKKEMDTVSGIVDIQSTLREYVDITIGYECQPPLCLYIFDKLLLLFGRFSKSTGVLKL
jgi:hypothetical protein